MLRANIRIESGEFKYHWELEEVGPTGVTWGISRGCATTEKKALAQARRAAADWRERRNYGVKKVEV
jgi:hypothetical protein